jgi:hypothetical protein
MISPTILKQFCIKLEELKPGWTIYGSSIVGPDGATVHLSRGLHSNSPGHIDVRFQLSALTGKHPGLWDCVTGFGETDEDIGRTAAHIWGSTTAPALFELQYSRRGEFADHYRGYESEGFSGWHSITGNIIGYGDEGHASHLQTWWINNPFLPTISLAVEPSLDEMTAPHGLKIFFGGNDIAEVRLNGNRHEGASQALLDLDWPRLTPPAFVRSYIIVIHREI